MKRHGRQYLRGHFKSVPPKRQPRPRPYTFYDAGKKRWYVALEGGGRIARYRQVMAEHLGRDLSPGEVVHHINGDSTDDRIENLELFASNKEHMTHAHGSA